MSAGMSAFDTTKWEAFRLAKQDNADGLGQMLDHHSPRVWTEWRNFAGRTIYQVAEGESKKAGQETRCLRMLHERLQRAMVPYQVPRVDYVERVEEVLQVVEKFVEVPVPEIHHHKTLKQVPDIKVTEVLEELSVPQYTIKDELRILEETVDVMREIPHTTIKEVPRFVPTEPKRFEETIEKNMEFVLPPVERVFEKPLIDVATTVQLVPGEQLHFREEEVILVEHRVIVPKTEVQFVKEEVIRQREVPVKHLREVAVHVPEYHEEYKVVSQTETEIIQNIKYVPKLPMMTEWVLPGAGKSTGLTGLSAEFDLIDADHDGVISPGELRAAGGSTQEFRRIDADRSGGISRGEYIFDRLDSNHDGVITRAELRDGLARTWGPSSAADLKDDMWCALNMARCEHDHLVKMSTRVQHDLLKSKDRVQRLREELQRERRLREDEERRLRQEEAHPAASFRLASLPVRREKNLEVERLLGSPASTVFRPSPRVDITGIMDTSWDAQTLEPSIAGTWEREHPRSRADDLFDCLDRNHDGVITRDEFQQGMLQRPVGW